MLSRCVVSQVKHNSYFLVGLALGLWLALAAVPLEEEGSETAACAAPSVAVDEWQPVREQREMGAAGAAGRSVQRPRYYSTELGMRAGLLAGALTSEEALGGRAAALNRTAARLLPALRFFITAGTLRTASAGANVVGFTDTREMLKPFHALKYLADNYLEEYDFFFLVTDTTFVNARRLTELVSKLSVSQDVYMGTVAEDDTQYCTLEGGILLSNSVLRAVHGALDWCVRNSYSPHHHENVGRCVLHAAHVACTPELQGERYTSLRLAGGAPEPALADAVTAQPVHDPRQLYQLHAYVSRVLLQRAQAGVRELRAGAAQSARRHPRGFRNATWPPGLRTTPGLAPATPANRFDHLRWTTFNATHALMPDEHRTAAPLDAASRAALQLVLEEVEAWAKRRWSSERVKLVEGAWCWQPPHALRYRLLLALQLGGEGGGSGAAVRQVEVARALGGARLVPARYVTESARVLILLPVTAHHASDALAFLRRYDTVCLQRDKNTALLIVLAARNDSAALEPVRAALGALAAAHRGAQLDVAELELPAPAPGESAHEALRLAQWQALLHGPRVPADTLVLLLAPQAEFSEDFLNRVRMNTIRGEQWFLPVAFARYAQFAHPRFRDASGARPQQNTGRFNRRTRTVLSFYRDDFDAALELWQRTRGAEAHDAAQVLAHSALFAHSGPEPALLLTPAAPPCAPADLACLQRARADGLQDLDLGARHALAKLLLETQADLD
ncbi:chondroitin sulfate synthase 2 [Battus philenor]|uniref:chondroitin sulfate synthase 2 n=1 Tax=Battus philenor TaxID=42288 RepID=UPI0035CED239